MSINQRQEVAFQNNGLFIHRIEYFEDTQCLKPTSRFWWAANYTLGDQQGSSKSADIRNIDFIIDGVYDVYFSQKEADEANSLLERFGKKPVWMVDVPRFVGGEAWPDDVDEMPTRGSTYFNILAMDNLALRFGKTSGENDGTALSRRPKELQSNIVFYKVQSIHK